MACETPSDTDYGARERTRRYLEDGWCRFPFDDELLRWVKHALPSAREAVAAPKNAEWLRCGGTWFAGVNVLPNDKSGAIDEGPSLEGGVIRFIRDELNMRDIAWDRGQVSVCYPGYPKPMPSESEAAFGYRCRRDAAHVDGFARVGPERRRFLREQHLFILGVPLAEVGEGASPFVVWERSHRIVHEMLASVFPAHQPASWSEMDVTEAYHAVRRRVFETCRRVEVHAAPGEAYLVHRHALHGMAPWKQGARSGEDGRMIVYFRPNADDPARWLAGA